jgi:hypothetical protein
MVVVARRRMAGAVVAVLLLGQMVLEVSAVMVARAKRTLTRTRP